MKLAKRERYLTGMAICFIVVASLVQFVVFPFFEGRERLLRGVAVKEAGVREIAKLAAEYQVVRAESSSLEQLLAERSPKFTLFSFLEREAGATGVKDYIKYMKPSVSGEKGRFQESLVEMKLEGIALKQLVDYLDRIESSDNVVSIKRISVQQNKKKDGYLDAILQVLTYQR